MEQGILTDTDYRVAVGARLRALIDALNISYVAAAEDMGVTKNHLGNWLRGTAYPMHYNLYRFCRIRGVNTDYVFLDDPSGLPDRVSRVLLGLAPSPKAPEELESQENEPKPRRRVVKKAA